MIVSGYGTMEWWWNIFFYNLAEESDRYYGMKSTMKLNRNQFFSDLQLAFIFSLAP